MQRPRETTPGPSRQANNHEDETMDTEELSSSACALNLSGILNKTFDGTSDMLKWLENEDHASPGPTEPNQTNQTFLDEKSKKLKASLIILAKASHHRTFMETCLHAKTPPRNICLWVEPHIYHATKETEKEWRDTLVTASLKLLATLIKHYSKIIEEKHKLDSTLEETKTYLREIRDKSTRDTETQTWKNLKQRAESEAKTISEDLREQRNKKITQRTQRKRKREESVEDDTPQPKKSFVEALRGLMNEYKDKSPPKNKEGPQRGARNTLNKGK